MSSKAALKAVRTALDSQDYETAAAKAQELVQADPSNYHAYVCRLPHPLGSDFMLTIRFG